MAQPRYAEGVRSCGHLIPMKTKIIGLVAVALLAMAPVAAADSKTTTTADAPCNIITQSLFEYLACEGGSTVREVCDDLFGPLNCDSLDMAGMAAASAPCNIITQSLFEYIACIGGQEVRELCDEIFGTGNCDSIGFATMTSAAPLASDAPCSLIYQGLVEYIACVGGREVRELCDEIFGTGNCDSIGVGRY